MNWEWIQGYSYNNVNFTHAHVFQRRRERGGVAGSWLIIVPSVKEKRLQKSQQIPRYLSGLWLTCDARRGACLHVEFIIYVCVCVGGICMCWGQGALHIHAKKKKIPLGEGNNYFHQIKG